MAKIRVGVNGFGTIGKRVATAVSAQDDMELVGVTKTRPSFEARSAIEKGYGLYVPADNVQAFKDAGIELIDLPDAEMKTLQEKATPFIAELASQYGLSDWVNETFK